MIVHVVGARPQFIKLKAVFEALGRCGMPQSIVHTGQHYDAEMSAIFFEELDIPDPDHSLDVGPGTQEWQIGAMMEGLVGVLQDLRPRWVLLYGDTNSTIAGALAANIAGKKVAHVEAGMRCGRLLMPEERNRIVADHLSDLLFAASREAMENLEREGLGERAILVGDTMLDVLRGVSDRLGERPRGVPPRYVLGTVHRAENTDDPKRLAEIVEGFRRLAVPVVLPLHPRTRRALERDGWDLERLGEEIWLREPVGYMEMLRLIRHAELVVTDSGGVQREAYYLEVPCITLRRETEWPETLAHGANRLIWGSAEELRAAVEGGVTEIKWEAPYGDGEAGRRIADVLWKKISEE